MRKPQENPIKYFGFVLVPFITFLLGWSVGFDQAESKFTKRLDSSGQDKSTPSEVLSYQRVIMDTAKRAKLNDILDRFAIEASSPRLPDLYKRIKGQRLQGILQEKQDDFLNSLYGFITKPDLEAGQYWEITYEEFCTKIADLTNTFYMRTKIFPSVEIPLDAQILAKHKL